VKSFSGVYTNDPSWFSAMAPSFGAKVSRAVTSTVAEVMRPLAAPVLGGMVSSFIHIMIVTPILFAWLRERGKK